MIARDASPGSIRKGRGVESDHVSLDQARPRGASDREV